MHAVSRASTRVLARTHTTRSAAFAGTRCYISYTANHATRSAFREMAVCERPIAGYVGIPCTDAGIARAGACLRAGVCVAFPTETVYGLGANALDAAAVASIFTYKGRPLTDPLIVHVHTHTRARELIELTPEVRRYAAHRPVHPWPGLWSTWLVDLVVQGERVFNALASEFWPGPLTIIGRAHACIPPLVTANTGFVGVRVPAHTIARALLEAAGVPVAAPSANRFGHVSPTRAAHVISDLGSHPICVLLGEGEDDSLPSTCGVGIESTVAKIDTDTAGGSPQLVVYRRGGISIQQLQAALFKHGLGDVDIVVRTLHTKTPPAAPTDAADASPATAMHAATTVGAEAPGMLLTHYAPDIPTYLVVANGDDQSGVVNFNVGDVASAVVVDFGARLKHLQASALAYRDLSPAGDVLEARAQIFDALRWTEGFPDAKAVLLMDPAAHAPDVEHVDALRDRMFRAASGREVILPS